MENQNANLNNIESGIHIGTTINRFIKLIKTHKHLQTSEDRLRLLEMLSNDPVIIDYLSSQWYRDRNIKRKTDFRSEEDVVYMQKMDYIVNFILWPNQKDFGIISWNQKQNKGRHKPDSNGYKESYTRTLTMSDVVDVEGEIKRGYKPRGYLDQSTGTFYERLLTGVEPIWNTDLNLIDLGNPEHVRVLLERYDEWCSLLVEQSNLESEMGNLLSLLDDLIDQIDFKGQEMYLIDLLKTGNYTYKQIEEYINLTYRQIEHKARVAIPTRIAKTYRRLKGKKQEDISNVKWKKIIHNSLIDPVTMARNKKRCEQYKRDTTNSPVITSRLEDLITYSNKNIWKDIV